MRRLIVITNKGGVFEMKVPTKKGVKVFKSKNFNELLRIADEIRRTEEKG